MSPKKPRENVPADAAAIWVPIASLHGWERNPRKHGKTVPKLVRAIIRYGWGAPIEARTEDREIIAGHGRMQAAERIVARWAKESPKRRESWHPEAARVAVSKQVPARLRDLGKEDAHQAAISDNRVGQDSGWQKDELSDLLADFEDDLQSMGFDEDEVVQPEDRARPTRVEVSELTPTFTLTVSGPLTSQADALQVIRDQLDELQGVDVDCFVEDFGAAGQV